MGITGFSTPFFGVQWEKTKRDKTVASHLVTFLEDRRVLFGERHCEDERHCIMSALQIRAFLTEQITEAKPGRELEASLRAMRAACRRFLDRGGPDGRDFQRGRFAGYETDPFSLALGDMRTTVGHQLALILSQYPMPVEPDLQSILPPSDEPEQELGWLPGVDDEWWG